MTDSNFVGLLCSGCYLIGMAVGYLLRKVTRG
jgi:hypothetical protein